MNPRKDCHKVVRNTVQSTGIGRHWGVTDDEITKSVQLIGQNSGRIVRVGQYHRDGCGAACLAMVLGLDYAEAYTHIRKTYKRDRLYHVEIVKELERRGVKAWWRKWYDFEGDVKHPKPGTVHILMTSTSERRMPHHYVVVDETGRVFDPAFEDGRLDRYADFGFIVVARIRED